MNGTEHDDRDRGSTAVREYAAGAVQIAALFDPGHPSWAGATALVLGDPFLRDLLIAQMIMSGSYDRAVAALSEFPADAAGNRDAVVVAGLWLSGRTVDAAAVSALSVNRSARLIGTVAATGIPAQRWADALVVSLLGPR